LAEASARPDDAALRKAMKAVAAERRRFGYWRVHVMLDSRVGPLLADLALPNRLPGNG